MKKSLLILAAAGAIALTGCSKTEFVSAPHDAIGFRTSVATATKATSTTTTTLASFNAYAINHSTGTAYFEDVTFTKGEGGTFSSASEYIWPGEGSLDFYAYAPVSNTQVVKTDYKTFTVTPSTTASEQVDFIYANTNEKSKASNAGGVAINFRHTESQIVLKVKNSSASLKFEVAGWKVAYLSTSGKFTYADSNTDAASTQLANTSWSDLGTAAVTNTYEQSLTSSVSVAASASTAADIGESFILIPQSQTAATGYAAATAGSAANGSYIAVKLIIKNAIDGSVIYSDGAATPGAAWAMWPVDFEWEPGKKYTYVVDLAGCGFKETEEGDDNTDLDKVYEAVPVTFVNVTVDEFAAQNDIDVTMPVNNFLHGEFSVSATKKVHFSKGNLWAGSDKVLHFEDAQWKSTTASNGEDMDANHVSLFNWSNTVGNAVTYSPYGNYLFCDESHKVSVDGSMKIYYALSKDEWVYLFDTRSASEVNGTENARYAKSTVNNTAGVILLPDSYTHPAGVDDLNSINKTDAEFTDNNYNSADWAKIESAGAVFLPAAGRREQSRYEVKFVGTAGNYWSSTSPGSSSAYSVVFAVDGSSNIVSPGGNNNTDLGCSIRLITDVTE